MKYRVAVRLEIQAPDMGTEYLIADAEIAFTFDASVDLSDPACRTVRDRFAVQMAETARIDSRMLARNVSRETNGTFRD